MANSPVITSSSVLPVLRQIPAAFAAGVVAYAIWDGGYIVTVVGFGLIYTIFVAGLNIFMGYAGQTSFGQNAFAAIGAYASAVLTATYHWPPIAGVAAGLAGSVICATVVGYPTLRLKGHYLAMATLAIGRFELISDRAQLVFLAIVAGIALLSVWLLRNSRFGRALVALSGSEDAARALGINVSRFKLAAFVISAIYASIAGSLLVHIIGFVSPEMVGMNMVILAFTMLYVGGIGTTVGPLIGAIVISLLPESIRSLKDYQDLVYGAALILILIYAPGGIASLGSLFRKRMPAISPAVKS